jgi:hypothetical protein
MASGSHHQAHHLATAKGEFMHSNMLVVPDVNLDENVDGSPYDVCLWHLADLAGATLHFQLLTQSGH